MSDKTARKTVEVNVIDPGSGKIIPVFIVANNFVDKEKIIPVSNIENNVDKEKNGKYTFNYYSINMINSLLRFSF